MLCPTSCLLCSVSLALSALQCCNSKVYWVMPIALYSCPHNGQLVGHDCALLLVLDSSWQSTPAGPCVSCIALLLQAHIGDIDNIKGCLPYARINKQKAARK